MEVFTIQGRHSDVTAIKFNDIRALVFAGGKPDEWTTGTPAIVAPPAGEFLRGMIVRSDGGMSLTNWPDEEPWPLSEDLSDHVGMLMVLMTCFPSDKEAAQPPN